MKFILPGKELPSKILHLVCYALLIISPGLSFEDSDLLDEESYEDVTTKKSNVKAHTGKFEGIFVEKVGDNIAKSVTISFLFSDEPYYGTTFFDYYDTTARALTLDFYDFKLGGSIIESVNEFPILRTEVEEMKIDLNKDVQGFQPDVRNVVRVRFFSDYHFPYDIGVDEFNMLTLKFKWDENSIRQISKSDGSFHWFVLFSVIMLSGLGYSSLLLLM
ncbi:MAG: hypothetical protein HQK83_13575 [Fibrobacteria bacterium]|nr:hypothetical protein [Fibrobacteria bacterium]